MAKVKVDFCPAGFNELLELAKPHVNAEAYRLASRAGTQHIKVLSSYNLNRHKFASSPRPGAVVTVDAQAPSGRQAANDRLDKALP